MELKFPDRIDWDAPVEGGWFLPLPHFQLRKEKLALLIIDMQNYLSLPDVGYGPILHEKMPRRAHYYFSRFRRNVVPANRELLAFFRSQNLRVLFTRVGPLLEDGSNMILRRQDRDRAHREAERIPTLWPIGTYEHKIIDELRPRRNEYVFDKNSSSAFNSTAIDQILRNMGVEDIVITGVATDMCVETTARDAADRGYNIVIVEDGTATFEPISHVASLYNFAKTYGMVQSSNEVIQRIQT